MPEAKGDVPEAKGDVPEAKGDVPEAKGATIRAFVALDLDARSLQVAAQVAVRLRDGAGAPSATWNDAEKMHVTVKFAGELPAEAEGPLKVALAGIAEQQRALKACSLRIDAFPAVEHARILVLELVDGDGALAELAASVDQLFASHGVPRDERPFRPHVTLARLKRPHDARRWLRPVLTGFSASCTLTTLALYRSDLGPNGSQYTPLARFALPQSIAEPNGSPS